MKIGFVLKEARKRAGFKQNEAAALIGISQTYLSQIESDNKKASTQIIEEICFCYGTPAQVILWKSITEKDVKKSKQKIFRELKPLIDNLIDQIFTPLNPSKND